MKQTAVADEFTLRAIVERYLSSGDEELSSGEVEDCLEMISDSCLPIKEILQTIAEDCLPPHPEWSGAELQKVVDALQPLFQPETPLMNRIEPVKICIEPEVWVEIDGRKRKANAAYDWDEKCTRVMKVSARYLASSGYWPGKWVGTLLHELTHAYVENTYANNGHYKARRHGHNVWFFEKALSIQVQLELVLSKWTSLRDAFGFMDLNLQTTLERYADLRRHYFAHLEKARRQLRGRISKEVGYFLLSTKEQRQRRREDRYVQFKLVDEGCEDECSEAHGDVSFYPQLFDQMIDSYA